YLGAESFEGADCGFGLWSTPPAAEQHQLDLGRTRQILSNHEPQSAQTTGYETDGTVPNYRPGFRSAQRCLRIALDPSIGPTPRHCVGAGIGGQLGDQLLDGAGFKPT